MIETMSRSQTRELDMLRHIRAVIALSLIIIAGPAEAGQLAAPVEVETRDLVLNGGFFTYDNTFTTVDPSTQVTVAGFVDGRNPGYGHMQDVIADFSLQGVSTSTPVPLLLDVSQVLTNGSSSFPFPVTLEIGVVGATGTINPADFPTLAAWQPPGTPFWTMLTPGITPLPKLSQLTSPLPSLTLSRRATSTPKSTSAQPLAARNGVRPRPPFPSIRPPSQNPQASSCSPWESVRSRSGHAAISPKAPGSSAHWMNL